MTIRQNYEKGSSLLVVLITIAVISVFSLVIVSFTLSTAKQVNQTEEQMKTYDLAEMGITFFEAIMREQQTKAYQKADRSSEETFYNSYFEEIKAVIAERSSLSSRMIESLNGDKSSFQVRDITFSKQQELENGDIRAVDHTSYEYDLIRVDFTSYGFYNIEESSIPFIQNISTSPSYRCQRTEETKAYFLIPIGDLPHTEGPKSDCLIHSEPYIDVPRSGGKIILKEGREGSSIANNPVVIEPKVQQAISGLKRAERERVLDDITLLESLTSNLPELKVIDCQRCSIQRIQNEINQSNAHNIILKTDSLNINRDFTFGSKNKKVILITDRFKGDNSEITMNGDLIIKQDLEAQNHFTFNGTGNLFAIGDIEIGTGSTISISETLYANKLVAKNHIDLIANTVIINGVLDLHTQANIVATTKFLTGSFEVGNVAEIFVKTGDLLVEQNYTSRANANIKVGGHIAVGGSFSPHQNTIIQTGGGKTAINIEGSVDESCFYYSDPDSGTSPRPDRNSSHYRWWYDWVDWSNWYNHHRRH
ncbi:hypothetical protein [Halalkalibacter nanhaiisediminis]|uniref:Uncharacterized protein n=1 Tax=Halalkalibacter nanhaiisediminis TaxID=688079 RepID=A0A562QJY8_9BACI|nr:hypothetical protein [Halalkalibacter nanhaiisediminis]TWI57088.1 hypothetical protein IQ10_01791 [Halalkalibacter nanhaiisediminis]